MNTSDTESQDVEKAEFNYELTLLHAEIDKVLFRVLTRKLGFVELSTSIDDVFLKFKRT
jgi:hypothetical protein